MPFGGAKVSDPFAGRVEELRELTEGMGGDKTIVAVVGMAGQGKSCLAGEWYKHGARPPEGVGLFWRKVYEPGFTFDKFLDELHLYLTGEHIDRHAIATVEARAVAVEGLLKDKPCWIVLDGVERWLRLWAAEPDAGVENPSADDKSGQDPVFDKFLTGASFWDNGSRLLLTTRAVPGALDENPPVRIGRKREADARLTDLKPADAVKLLRELSVKGNKEVLRQAVDAYGCHPYAVHVLGALIRDLYGGDGSQWQQVNPLGDTKLEGLFERIIEHRGEDLELLEYIACSVGPAPVLMLAERLGQDETEIRKKLAELARWQMVEFDGGEAGQHTVVRKVMASRMGQERVRELQKQIALWWAGREVPDRPVKIEEIRPLLKAIEHLLAAGEPLAAMHIFFTKTSAESYYTLSGWLRTSGYLDEGIRICSDAIRVYEELIERESRRELRNNLAGCYNNRANAFQVQGKLAEAIADYGRAIEIYKELVEKESRRELRWDLKMSLFNRAVAFSKMKDWRPAGADIEKGGGLLRELIEEGWRHVIGSFLKTAGFRCRFAKELGDDRQAAQWANDGMRWFIEEAQAGRMNELLVRDATEFAGGLKANIEVLVAGGLDEELLERFLGLLKDLSSD